LSEALLGIILVPIGGVRRWGLKWGSPSTLKNFIPHTRSFRMTAVLTIDRGGIDITRTRISRAKNYDGMESGGHGFLRNSKRCIACIKDELALPGWFLIPRPLRVLAVG
jgi:hypothetical protein